MLILLDTNIYYDNWFLTSPQFALLANYCQNNSAILLVPQVVVNEVEAKFNQKWKTLTDILDGLPRQFDELQADKSHLPTMPSKIAYNFLEVVFTRFPSSVFLTYENIPHGPLVKRAINSTRPFRDKEKGYRDTLLWETLLIYLS